MAITVQTVQPHSIEESLRALLAVEESRSSNKGIRDRLLALEKKLAAGQLHLAVLGQMKRGKSSFINALLGAEILPTGVLPVTRSSQKSVMVPRRMQPSCMQGAVCVKALP